MCPPTEIKIFTLETACPIKNFNRLSLHHRPRLFFARAFSSPGGPREKKQEPLGAPSVRKVPQGFCILY